MNKYIARVAANLGFDAEETAAFVAFMGDSGTSLPEGRSLLMDAVAERAWR